tara:strand:+ start:302 stop:916 length:615 start_codon:yes stop_codon:yes gene_type:complete
MPVIAEMGDIPSTSFIMDNVSEVLNSEATTYERRDIPAGVYSVQVCNVLPREYFDKKDCFGGDSDSPMPDAIIKRLIPLEIIEGEFASERTLISIYMEPDKEKYNDEERYKTHMKKYKMGCERIAKLAQACGLDSITDLDDCAGKFVRVTLTGREYNGKTYLDMKSAEKYGAAKPVLTPPKQETAPKAATTEEVEQEIKKDILF